MPIPLASTNLVGVWKFIFSLESFFSDETPSRDKILSIPTSKQKNKIENFLNYYFTLYHFILIWFIIVFNTKIKVNFTKLHMKFFLQI